MKSARRVILSASFSLGETRKRDWWKEMFSNVWTFLLQKEDLEANLELEGRD